MHWVTAPPIFLQTSFEASSAEDFSKHCCQRRNYSSWAISPFATILSTQFNNDAFIYRDFSDIFQYVFEVLAADLLFVWERRIIIFNKSVISKGKEWKVLMIFQITTYFLKGFVQMILLYNRCYFDSMPGINMNYK